MKHAMLLVNKLAGMPALRTFQQLSASFSWALNIDGMLRTNGINTPVSIITSCSLQKTSSSSGTFMYHYDVLLVFPMEFCSFALDIPEKYIKNSERLKDAGLRSSVEQKPPKGTYVPKGIHNFTKT